MRFFEMSVVFEDTLLHVVIILYAQHTLHALENRHGSLAVVMWVLYARHVSSGLRGSSGSSFWILRHGHQEVYRCNPGLHSGPESQHCTNTAQQRQRGALAGGATRLQTLECFLKTGKHHQCTSRAKSGRLEEVIGQPTFTIYFTLNGVT